MTKFFVHSFSIYLKTRKYKHWTQKVNFSSIFNFLSINRVGGSYVLFGLGGNEMFILMFGLFKGDEMNISIEWLIIYLKKNLFHQNE